MKFKWWWVPAGLIAMYAVVFPFYFRNPEHPLFFTVYSVFNGTLEHQTIDGKKEELVSNYEEITVGSKAPDLTLQGLRGNQISLSDFEGKTVLLTFWASWCPTCRAENKHLKEIYPDYKNNGFEILAVSLDRSKTNWEKAVEKDGITWPQVSDLQGVDSPVPTKYGVYSTPTTFLIDSSGVIIGKDLRGVELEEQLNSLK
ncbi:MAG: TlpA family protein disulfide reductase [Balneola sp.]|nr:TlpA family protein disulfide reductase [Balneola sp.]MBO6650659.1 TlpA family protein disulfide reductase [Balneola sp.]MBO6712562.1 TlpA family protein disulfide reductase [Balneola sp.]MBO6800944.1 TlpA family protein disulfide reductase [Balneola sp.]MBO6870617.1 TlpA family protein disulfide reductase [Balneola sp.]